jgi:acetyl esterase/lipase
MFIAQGTADQIVAPSITEAYVQKLCDAGQTVDLRLYDGVSHIDTGPDAAPDVAAWLAARFAGEAASSTCA